MQGQNPFLSAQYYNSDLSIWLSVDPMVDKYPNLSPYTYCANNPVRIFDPDGRDTIFVDKKIGKTTIYNRVGNDVLICGKKTVTLSGKSVYADAEAKGKEQVKKGSTLLVGMSNYDAKKTFNFMADNTGVEWGYMESVNSSGQTEFLVGSAHSSETESLVFGKAMDATEGSVLRYDHNHLFYTSGATAGWPSTPDNKANKEYEDTAAWSTLLEKNPTLTLGIRYRGTTILFIENGKVADGYKWLKKYIIEK